MKSVRKKQEAHFSNQLRFLLLNICSKFHVSKLNSQGSHQLRDPADINTIERPVLFDRPRMTSKTDDTVTNLVLFV